MKTVILCGGKGTRLHEETEYRPKPLVEIGGRPVLWHIMKHYAHYGFNDFVLCLGYRGNMIKQYFLTYDQMNNDFTICLGQKGHLQHHARHDEEAFRVTLADTGEDTMTGGRILRICKYIDGDEFMVTYGDGLSDVNVSALVNFHRSHGRLATVTAVSPFSRFGIVDIGPEGNITGFLEKPKVDGLASSGFFVFNRGVFDYLDGDDCVLEQAPLQRLSQEGQLMAFCHDGFFYAMDTYREYLQLNKLWGSNAAPWKVW